MSELSLYSGATGMENEQTNLDVIANNLANINTPGFKRSKAEFSDLLYQTLRTVGADAGSGDAAPTGIEIGNGSQLVSASKVFTQGSLEHTGRELDLAIDGDGFIEVQRPDGSSAYTRAGNLKVNSSGQVTTSNGFVVQSNFQTIPSGSRITIASNGQTTVTLPSGSAQNFRIQLTRFANPAGLKNIGNNLLLETPASGSPEIGNPDENGFGSIIQSHIEKSNVSAVQSMVDMIIAQRSYEMNSKSIQTSEEMLGVINHLKR